MENCQSSLKSLDEVKSEIGPSCQAVVVESDGGFFIHGKPLNLEKDINPGAKHQKHQLRLWRAGAKLLYGEENVLIIGGPEN